MIYEYIKQVPVLSIILSKAIEGEKSLKYWGRVSRPSSPTETSHFLPPIRVRHIQAVS
jgi:hypothetical protein